ncbi:hypothetical protein [Kaistella carnis]|uniref:Uncharacterized protein n=1 Tax=Kaistella carnis TaxID=1241979 RepID=A0A3G8XVQ8_9FLAO|nr:hypothetical protein [Kaistella carnis]AZI32781.1 hypothetical protein EIB73_06045 [Kaistella carnis]
MTDFIDKFLHTGDLNYQLRVLHNYKDFLKQPLKLEMFVPCNENGNVLEEPQMRPERNSFCEEDMDYDARELYDYIKAKEKVLFENISNREINYFINHFQKIEDLLQSRGGKNLKLSHNALNAIFDETVA